MNDSKLISIQAGRARSFDNSRNGQQWQSAIIKEPINGPVSVGTMGVDGDEQVDRENHGGIDKALLAYSADHFEFWRNEYAEEGQSSPSIAGAFGENLTIASQAESDVCVGDFWRVGNCLLQVSQPRQPCWKLSRRWALTDLAARVQKSLATPVGISA